MDLTTPDSPEILTAEAVLPSIDRFEHEVFADHHLVESRGINVGLENIVGDEAAEHIWVAYQRGYQGLNASSLSRQNLHKDEFMEEMSDSTIIKYVARKEDGTPVGFMAVEKGISRETSPFWDQQDDKLLETIQKQADPNAPSFCIITFLVDKESDAYMLRTSEIILQGALQHFEEVCKALNAYSYCFFDFAPDNHFLPQYIMDSGKPKGNFKGVDVNIWPVYTQEWYSVPAEVVTPKKLEEWAGSFPDDVFGDSVDPAFNEGIPLEIQPENLPGNPEEYCSISDLASITGEDSKERIEKLFNIDTSLLKGKKHVLINMKRLADGWDNPRQSLGIGERLSEQTYAAMELKQDPRVGSA